MRLNSLLCTVILSSICFSSYAKTPIESEFYEFIIDVRSELTELRKKLEDLKLQNDELQYQIQLLSEGNTSNKNQFKNENNKELENQAITQHSKIQTTENKNFTKIDDEYNLAYETLVKEKNMQKARDMFEDLVTKYPNYSKLENAYYWLGQIYYKMGDYQKSMIMYGNGYKANQNGNRSIDNLFGVVECLKKMDEKDSACKIMENLLSEIQKNENSIKKYYDKYVKTAETLDCKID